MKICILGPVNPADLKIFLDNPESVWNSGHSFGSVVALIKGLIELEHEVYVISATQMPHNALCYDGPHLHVRIVNTKSHIPLSGFFFFDKFVPHRIEKELNKIIGSIDILHAQWTYEYALATLKYADKIPTFCTVRDWYPYIKQFASISNYFYLLAKGRMFKKVISNNHISFIANSEYTRKLLEKSLQRDVPVLYNPVASDFYVSEGIYQAKPVFLSVAQNLDEQRKNISLLLLAFKKVLKTIPDAILILVGKYSMDGVYKEAQNLQLSKSVIFKGAISRESLKTIIDNCRIYVHPALEETFGNVLLEAMVRQKPVIGGDASGAVPYVLKGGEQGVLCNILSHEAIAEAMIDLHTNKLKYKSLIEKNLSYVQGFRDRSIAVEHCLLYNKTID